MATRRTEPVPRKETYGAPADCPVCGDHLLVTRLGCESCGSELSGLFSPCDYCALDDADSELLRVFLISRGNMRELEKHLGVSYPTARARFTTLLQTLGLDTVAVEPEPASRDQILAEVAAGRLTPAEAQELLLADRA